MKKNFRHILEITDTHVKFIQSQPIKDKRVISACDVKTIRLSTDDEIANLINSLLSGQKNIAQDLTVVIPRRFVILKQFRLPSLQEAEIKKMLSLQLPSHIPYPLVDVIYDFSIINKEPSGYSKALIFIIHKEAADRYLRLVQKSGFQVGELTVSSLGLKEWFYYQKKSLLQAVHEPVLLLNIDFSQTELSFFDDGKLLFSRSIALGSRDLTDDQLGHYVQQIELSLKTYVKENMGPEVKTILILSSLSEVSELKKRLELSFQMAVVIKDPLENILSQKNANLPGLKSDAGVSMAVGVGFCVTSDEQWINLMPMEVRTHRLNWKQRLVYIKTVILVALLLLSAASFLGVDLFRYIRVVNAYQDKTDALKKEYTKAQAKISFIETLSGQLKNRLFIPDLLTELYHITPTEISFRHIELNENGLLTIQGYATAGASVNQFQSILVKSVLFKEANLQFATQRRIFNMDVTDFQITAQVKGGRK